jgi:hypothetical protein
MIIIVQIKTPLICRKILQEIDFKNSIQYKFDYNQRRYDFNLLITGSSTRKNLRSSSATTELGKCNDVLIVFGKDKDIKKIID